MSLVNFGFISNKQDAAAGQQEAKENIQSAVQTKKQQCSKKRKWNDAFSELGFVKDSDEKPFGSLCFQPRHMQQFINGKA